MPIAQHVLRQDISTVCYNVLSVDVRAATTCQKDRQAGKILWLTKSTIGDHSFNFQLTANFFYATLQHREKSRINVL